jgi:putative peptide zinc metalloprotease protein
MDLTEKTIVTMIPIVIRMDKINYIIEDKTSGEFYEMPEVCIDAINLMNDGMLLGKVEEILIEKYPNEEVNILDFANQLLELGLIAEIDGVKVERQQKQKEKLGFQWISPKLGKFFFNRFTYFLYLGLFIVNLSLFIIQPSLFPHHMDIFVLDTMVFNVILWMLLTFLLVLFHEFGHVLSMRAHDLPTKVEVGHRLFFVVLETDMSSVWKLAPKERNVLYLAGLCFDNVILFIALILQLLIPGDTGIAFGLLSLAVFDIVLRMIYQCCIYVKTDLYYVFENVSGCYNLMENAHQKIRQRLTFLKQKSSSEEVVFSGERKTISLFSIFYFLGIAISIALYVIYYIPEIIHAGEQLLPGFGQPPASLAFWDAVLFSMQVGIFVLLLLYSWRKKYIKNEM